MWRISPCRVRFDCPPGTNNGRAARVLPGKLAMGWHPFLLALFLLLQQVSSQYLYEEECSDVGRFLVLSDTQLSWSAPPAEYGQKSSILLLNSVFRAMTSAFSSENDLFRGQTPDFVLHLGNMVYHTQTAPLASDVLLKSMQTYTAMYEAHFGSARWNKFCTAPLFVMGNKDVRENFIHGVGDRSWRKEIAQTMWLHFHQDEAATDAFVRTGNYEFPSPFSPKLVFLVINTVFFSAKNPRLEVPTRGYKHPTLVWLRERLHDLHRRGMYAYIIGNIPPVVEPKRPMWDNEYAKAYHEILQEMYDLRRSTVRGQFFGHQFKNLIRLNAKHPMFLHGAVSPQLHTNPVFRRWAYCRTDGRLLDYKIWHLELNRTDENRSSPQWGVLVDSARSAYELKTLETGAIWSMATRTFEEPRRPVFRDYFCNAYGFRSSKCDAQRCDDPCVCVWTGDMVFYDYSITERHCRMFAHLRNVSWPYNETMLLEN